MFSFLAHIVRIHRDPMKSLIAAFHSHFVLRDFEAVGRGVIDGNVWQDHRFALYIHSAAQIAVNIRMAFNVRPCAGELAGSDLGVSSHMSIFPDKAGHHNGMIIDDGMVPDHSATRNICRSRGYGKA